MNTLTAAKLAAALDIPIVEIEARLYKLSDKEQRSFADYHRVLRSNIRAQQALDNVLRLRGLAVEIRAAVHGCSGKDPNLRQRSAKEGLKLVQELEITVKLLDTALSYKRGPDIEEPASEPSHDSAQPAAARAR